MKNLFLLERNGYFLFRDFDLASSSRTGRNRKRDKKGATTSTKNMMAQAAQTAHTSR